MTPNEHIMMSELFKCSYMNNTTKEKCNNSIIFCLDLIQDFQIKTEFCRFTVFAQLTLAASPPYGRCWRLEAAAGLRSESWPVYGYSEQWWSALSTSAGLRPASRTFRSSSPSRWPDPEPGAGETFRNRDTGTHRWRHYFDLTFPTLFPSTASCFILEK